MLIVEGMQDAPDPSPKAKIPRGLASNTGGRDAHMSRKQMERLASLD
jgi:hypothetical protein